MINTVTVLLTPEEAQMFKMFQQHHDIFIALLATGAFDIKYGKCVLNFAHGELQNIVREEVAWKK